MRRWWNGVAEDGALPSHRPVGPPPRRHVAELRTKSVLSAYLRMLPRLRRISALSGTACDHMAGASVIAQSGRPQLDSRLDFHVCHIVYHEACHEVECAIANVCQPWCQPHCSHALQFETGYGCIAVSPSRSPSFCRQTLKSMQAAAFLRVGSVDSRRF